MQRLMPYAMMIAIMFMVACVAKPKITKGDPDPVVKGGPTVAGTPGETAGIWVGPVWGRVVIRGNKGTYSKTYGTGPGRFTFQKSGDNSFTGQWGESKKRFGTMTFTISEDGKRITGTYESDPGCVLDPGKNGNISWRRIR